MVLAGCASAEASPVACPRDPAAIIVDTGEHRLALCESGKPVREVSVAIGRGGVDKRREGDRKTPLGRFALGRPRESARFHKFIAVDYPTPALPSEGRTGGDIGIHGPSRSYSWLGGARNWVDWTAGCIAVASDEVIDQIASRVVARQATVVVIR